MTKVFIFGALSSATIGLFGFLLTWVRPREVDESGNPQLRYVFAPYLMSLCGTALIGVGIYNWIDPLNHQYSGNLLILCYVPVLAGLLSFGVSIYFFTFRVKILESTIHFRRWPFGVTNFNRRDLMKIEQQGNSVVLQFANNRTIAITKMHSGRDHFLSALSPRD